MITQKTAVFKCSNANHADRKAAAYCSLCKAYFCGECERSHSNMLPHHGKCVTRDLTRTSSSAPEKCPLHGYELGLFCPVHYSLCCSKCNLDSDGPHSGCPVEPFDKDGNFRLVHKNLSADLSTLTTMTDKMTSVTVDALAAKQDEVTNSITAVKDEIKTAFDSIRNALSVRESAILGEVECIFNELSLSDVICKIRVMEDEVQKAVAAGQEALKLSESSTELWETVRKGCAVRELVKRVTELEKEAAKALKSVPKIIFEHSKDDLDKIANFGKLYFVQCCPQNVTTACMGWNKFVVKWDSCYREYCSCDEKKEVGEKYVYEIEMKKEGENDSKYTIIYKGEQMNCVLSCLQGDTVYDIRVRGVPKGSDGSVSGCEWSEEVKIRTLAVPTPTNLKAVTKSYSSICLSWDPISTGMIYRVKTMETTGAVSYEKVVECDGDTRYTAKELRPETKYSFSVQAGNGNTWGEWCSAVSAKTWSAIVRLPENCRWKECPGNFSSGMKYSVDSSRPKIATKTGEGWCAIVADALLTRGRVTKWGVHVLKSRNNGDSIWIGVIPSDVSLKDDINKRGWYFECYFTTLCSGPPHNYWCKEYGPKKSGKERRYVHTGDIVGVTMDTVKGELSFALNGVNYGLAYDRIPLDKPLVPCVLLEHKGYSIELIV